MPEGSGAGPTTIISRTAAAGRGRACAPEATGALDNEVDRRQVGDDQVEVEIERLLDNLRRDQEVSGALLWRAGLAEAGERAVLDRLAVAERKPAMEQLCRDAGWHRLEGSNCVADRVADIERRLPGSSGRDGAREAFVCALNEPQRDITEVSALGSTSLWMTAGAPIA